MFSEYCRSSQRNLVMSVLHLDIFSMSDKDSSTPFEALCKKTGFLIMEDIWLFTRPYVSHQDLIFSLRCENN